MSSPQTINGLMRHLRNDCHINIKGGVQKKQLISYGYYHGYKGYRFYAKRTNRIPYSDFEEVVAVIEYDNELKSIFYPELMFTETAIKNIVCNESVFRLKSSTFEYIFRERMSDNSLNVKLQSKRLRLRNSVYSKLAEKYQREENSDNQMVRHFYNRGEDAPLWVVFEILYLSDLASFFECLNKQMRIKILSELNMLDTYIDTNAGMLSYALYTIKAMRNAVAHNGIVFDSRFRDRRINKALKKWIEKETNINNITLYSLIDYLIILCCILKRIDFSGERAKHLIESYERANLRLKERVNVDIYDKVITSGVESKIIKLKQYLG